MRRSVSWSLLTAVVVVCLASQGAAQKNDLSDFMRVKLKNSQLVVEGLVLEDFDKITKNAQDLSLLSLAQSWQVLQTPQYLEHSRKFRAAADSLADAARKKDLDRATEAYHLVTRRCVECHKYYRDVRMARAD